MEVQAPLKIHFGVESFRTEYYSFIVRICISNSIAQKGYDGMVRLLIKYKADINAQENRECGAATPLHVAVRHGHTKVVDVLVYSGADVNCQDAQGFTPLHLAARSGRADIVELLLLNNADPAILDNGGKTPYYWAKENGYKLVASRLPQQEYDWFEQAKKMDSEFVIPEGVTAEKKAKKGKAKKGGKGKKGKKGKKK